MRETRREYCLGLEFYMSPETGLSAIENDENGNQGTYQYLTPQEAIDWLSAWMEGKDWIRAARYERERAHA